MPTSFSSCKAVLEILRREKKRGKINAHTGSPSSHTPALAQKPYQHLYEITFCPLEMPAGRSCQPCWLHFLSQSYPGAEASRALKPFVSPSCCPPHPLFPLLQHSQGGNRSVRDPLSLGSHPSFWSQQHFGEGSSSHLSPATGQEATSSPLRPWVTLIHGSFSPCNAQSMFNIPPFLSALQGDPELPGARVCPRQPSYPDNYNMFHFPGITHSFPSLPLNKYGCTAAAEQNQQRGRLQGCTSLPPCAPSAAPVPDSGVEASGWIRIFLPKCQAQVSVKTKEC